MLCSVARETVTPPTSTGCRRASGVRTPVRPTCTTMSSTRVTSLRGSNLYATAQRGLVVRKPSFSCNARSFTFITTPSIS